MPILLDSKIAQKSLNRIVPFKNIIIRNFGKKKLTVAQVKVG